MNWTIKDLSDPALPEAISANFAEEMACLARVLPGAELHDDLEIQWFTLGSDGFHGVLRAHLSEEDPEYVNARIDELVEQFRTRNLKLVWPVNPDTRPANLATYLEGRGFKHFQNNVIMVADIHTLHEGTLPAGITIREVLDEDLLRTWYTICMRGFETTEAQSHFYYDAYHLLGYGPGHPWHHYLSYLNEEPLGVASLLLHGGIAGIFGVATVPEARRRGVATALTRHALQEARAEAYRITALSPSEMAVNVYKNIGFQEHISVPFYRWTPEE